MLFGIACMATVKLSLRNEDHSAQSQREESLLNALMVGCGAMSKGWLCAIADTPELASAVRIVGFVDLDPAAAVARAAEFAPSAATGSDLAVMLADLRPDVVFDLVVPDARRAVVLTALAAGAHVLSEKPMGASLDDARTMIAAAQAAGKRHAVIQNRRFLPGIRRVRALLAQGALGELTQVHSDFFVGAHFGGFRDQMAHVLLRDMAIHTFDAARFIIGTVPRAVYCRETNPQGSWYAHGAAADALFDFDGGIGFTYRGSWCAEGANTAWEASWRIIGTKGTLIWDGNEGFSAHAVASDLGFIRPLVPVTVPPLADPLIEGHAGVIADFLGAVHSGRRPMTEGTDNIQSLSMALGAIESAETGQRVSLQQRATT